MEGVGQAGNESVRQGGRMRPAQKEFHLHAALSFCLVSWGFWLVSFLVKQLGSERGR